MKLESTFTITVTGDIRQGKKSIDLREWIEKAVVKLDPGVEVEEFIFARLGYRLVLTGRPSYLEVIDKVQRSVMKYTSIFLSKWEYRIIINYKESM